jgi:hypothetical protein
MKKAILFVVFFIIGFLAYNFLTNSSTGPATTGSNQTANTPKSSFTNAADAYIKAGDLTKDRAAQLGAGLPGTLKDQQFQEAMDLILDGSLATEIDYSAYYPVTMTFNQTVPNFLQIQILGKGLVAQAKEYRNQGNLDEALLYAKACLKYGQDMETEAYSIIQYLIGLALKKMAYQELAPIYQARGEIDLAGQMNAGVQDCDKSRDLASQFGKKLGEAAKTFDLKGMLVVYNEAVMPQSKLEGLTAIGSLFTKEIDPMVRSEIKDIEKFKRQLIEVKPAARKFVKKCLTDEDKKVRHGAKIVSDRLGWSL